MARGRRTVVNVESMAVQQTTTTKERGQNEMAEAQKRTTTLRPWIYVAHMPQRRATAAKPSTALYMWYMREEYCDGGPY